MHKLLSWLEYQGFENLIWATDLDKTLVDGNVNPEEISVEIDVEEALHSIDIMTNNNLFIVTGRELAMVDKIFPNVKFKASCEYNNIIRFNPQYEPIIQAIMPKWDKLDPLFEDFKQTIHPKIHIRKKIVMRSIHFRMLDDSDKEKVGSKLFAKIKSHLDEYNSCNNHELIVQDSGEAFDIGPYPSCKREAYKNIIEYVTAKNKQKSRSFVPIYFGDSLGDLNAGLFAKEKGGIFVLVGNDPRLTKYADFSLKNPHKYRQLLISIGERLPSGCKRL